MTDAGGPPPGADGGGSDKSGFAFDLGGALARLAADEPTRDLPPDGPDPVSTDDGLRAPAPSASGIPPADTALPAVPPPGQVTEVLQTPSASVATPSTDDALPVRDPVGSNGDAGRSGGPGSAVSVPRQHEGASRTDSPVQTLPQPGSPWTDTSVETQRPVQTGHPVETEPAPNYPRRVPGTHFDSQQRAQPAPEPPATVIDVTSPVQRQSVFEDAGSSPDPMFPTSAHAAPALPSDGASQMVSGSAPILPDAAPAAPAVTEPVTAAPANNDITALRSAKMRANRQQGRSRLFGRSLLAFVVVGSVLGAGLYFGRSLLFPTDWDPTLTPVVNELQDSRGIEFEDTVPLSTVDEGTYSTQLGTVAIGTDWLERLPEWRALGLAEGEVTPATVGAVLAGTTTAFYDPETTTIYRSEAIAPVTADLRLALIDALDHQQSELDSTAAEAEDAEGANGEAGTEDDAAEATGVAVAEGTAPTDLSTPGFTGVSPLSSIATGAVDHYLVSGSVDVRQPAPEGLPLPIAYEVVAVDLLGEPIVAAAGVEASTLTVGGPYPDAISGALDDRPVDTSSGLLQPGETSLADPVALGTDDWSLVWGARLPASTVDGLVAQVVADSYRPIQSNGAVCFVGVFQTADEASGAAVLTAMQSWAANAPVTSLAAATSLGATRVQLRACDPGAAEVSPPNSGVVDALIDRQQLRLAN